MDEARLSGAGNGGKAISVATYVKDIIGKLRAEKKKSMLSMYGRTEAE